MSDHPPQFSVKKLWIYLLVLTAAEVVYGYIGNSLFYENKVLLWGGLLLFAYFKGYYIFQYFMHMKYEGPIVKGNVWFTLPLVAYLMTMLTPDTAFNDQLNSGIAQQLDPKDGVVKEHMDQEDSSRNVYHHEYHGEQRHGSAEAQEFGYLYSATPELKATGHQEAPTGH